MPANPLNSYLTAVFAPRLGYVQGWLQANMPLLLPLWEKVQDEG